MTDKSCNWSHADHIADLTYGHVEAEGKLDDLLRTSEEMQRLWAGDVGEREQAEAPPV